MKVHNLKKTEIIEKAVPAKTRDVEKLGSCVLYNLNHSRLYGEQIFKYNLGTVSFLQLLREKA